MNQLFLGQMCYTQTLKLLKLASLIVMLGCVLCCLNFSFCSESVWGKGRRDGNLLSS